ncbi:MAG: zinc ribbon domain-containing protein [Lachnospiraceae bacterium]|nr:zinc ribbon domain-containing protein [Lachnospiraceae bacterium]
MSVCSRCGTENLEGNEICTSCGAKIEEPQSGSERSLVWTLAAIVSIGLGLSTFFIESRAVTLVITVIALALAILAIIKKARLRAIPIIAVVITGLLLLVWGGSAAAKLATDAMIPDPQEYACGRVVFTVPGKFLSDVEESPEGYDFTSDIDMAFLGLKLEKTSIPDDQFRVNGEFIANVLKDRFAGTIENVAFEGIEYKDIGELKCLVAKYTGTVDGQDAIVNISYVNDPDADCSVDIVNIYFASNEEKNGNDLEEILANARFDSSINPLSGNSAEEADDAE